MTGSVLLEGTKSFDLLCLPMPLSLTALRTVFGSKVKMDLRSSKQTATTRWPSKQDPMVIVRRACSVEKALLV